MSGTFFIVGCHRSGTTAYARALDTASNAEVHVEQPPRLRIVSRDLLDGKLSCDPRVLLREKKGPAVDGAHRRGNAYGDKNACYLPFIPYLVELFDATIVWLVRDGREVVRSLMDWHDLHAGNFFVREEDGVDVGRSRPVDPWDYSRPRPGEGDPYHLRWTTATRFEKCAWYWAHFNRLAAELTSAVPDDRVIRVNVSAPDSPTSLKALFEALGLEGYDQERVEHPLTSRVNSLFDRSGKTDRFPSWREWPENQRRIFSDVAGEMMAELGYEMV